MEQEEIVDPLVSLEVRFNVNMSAIAGGCAVSWRNASTKLVFVGCFSQKDETKEIAYTEPLMFQHTN